MNYDYIYGYNKERYENLYSRKIGFKSKLKVIKVENGYLLPAKKCNNRLIGLGGVLDSSLNLVEESQIISGGAMVNFPLGENYEVYFGGKYELDNKKLNYLKNEVVYLGYINNHWGHFLIDFCTRLWYVSFCKPDTKYVFLVNENKNHSMIRNIKRFLELLEVPIENIEFVNTVTKCKNIIIPEASYITNKYYSNEYLSIFNKVASNVNISLMDNKKQIYFSRLGYSKAKSTEIGEELLIDIFKRNGFDIISPEKCSLDEQIALIRNSKIVAGIIGTIAHNMLFANDNQKMIIINKTFSLNTMQMDINIMKNLDITYIDSYISLFPVSLGHGPFMIVYSKELKKFIEDNKWNLPNENFISNSFEKKNVRIYEKRYRRLLSNKDSIIYEKNKDYSNYYNPEHLIDFYEKYYLLKKPILFYEVFFKSFSKGKFFFEKVLERIVDILKQRFHK
ncbi:glycosyltransferase 61 family protein [Clostridium perfringens]|nr:glycosyltransferase 61 family protein [Clostridium perfringens]